MDETTKKLGIVKRVQRQNDAQRTFASLVPGEPEETEEGALGLRGIVPCFKPTYR